MAITKFTAGTALLAKSAVDSTIQKMHDVCKTHAPHAMSKAPGDSQHPNDIKWMLKNGTTVLYSGSIPMTSHTAGVGNKNLKAAITTINKAIDYLNDL
ncbi:MAG: hypothetical protein KGN36_01515 [Acidobacteriota bacterium]|nr:hypothetical protein [Acidobacteriota bacterium]